MPTIVGILTFMSRINFVPSQVEHKKRFITLRPNVRKRQTTFSEQTNTNSKSNDNAELITERIQLARNTAYSLMGAGLYGLNCVNPEVSVTL